jgi:hypothetical protein
MLVAILHFIQDEDHPAEIIKTLVDALPPGSFVAASHLTGEHDRAAWATIERDYRAAGISAQWGDSDEFAQLAFTGLEMVPPGVVLVSEWRPEGTARRPSPVEVSFLGARRLRAAPARPFRPSCPGGTAARHRCPAPTPAHRGPDHDHVNYAAY